jgi:hypothetical protein
MSEAEDVGFSTFHVRVFGCRIRQGGGTEKLRRRRALDTRTRWVQSWSEDKETIAIGPCLAPLHLFTFVYKHIKRIHVLHVLHSYCHTVLWLARAQLARAQYLAPGACYAANVSPFILPIVSTLLSHVRPHRLSRILLWLPRARNLLAAPQFPIFSKVPSCGKHKASRSRRITLLAPQFPIFSKVPSCGKHKASRSRRITLLNLNLNC